jgi:hypothetical protein
MDPSNVTLFNTKIKDLESVKKNGRSDCSSARGFRALAAAPSNCSRSKRRRGPASASRLSTANQQPTGAMALKFLVRTKYRVHELSRRAMLPKSISGFACGRRRSRPFPSVRGCASEENRQSRGDYAQPESETSTRPARVLGRISRSE